MVQTLRDAMSTRDNALNFVRIVLAAVVIFDHTWVIGGYENSPEIPLAHWAVNGFFAISGYLIAGSRMRLGFREYMVNRALRIFPAFWVVLVLTAFVVAPLSTLFTGDDWQLRSAVTYVINNFALYFSQWGVDDTLQNVPFEGVWNGSLWTLFFEFVAYIVAALLLTLAWIRRHASLVLVAGLVGIIIVQILAYGPLEVSTNLFLNFLRFGGFFAAGMLLYFVGDRVRMRTSYMVIAMVTFAVMVAFGVADWVGQLPFAVILMWLGSRLPIRIGAKNDISYGLYIWAFPVQQFVIVLGLAWLGPWGTAILSLALTIPLAWLSWVYVERPMMRLRKRIPRVWLGKHLTPEDSAPRR